MTRTILLDGTEPANFSLQWAQQNCAPTAKVTHINNVRVETLRATLPPGLAPALGDGRAPVPTNAIAAPDDPNAALKLLQELHPPPTAPGTAPAQSSISCSYGLVSRILIYGPETSPAEVQAWYLANCQIPR